FKRVMEIAAVVHMDVSGSAVPTSGVQVGHAFQAHGNFFPFVRCYLYFQILREILESVRYLQLELAGRHRYRVSTGGVENVSDTCHSRVSIARAVEFAVCRDTLNA